MKVNKLLNIILIISIICNVVLFIKYTSSKLKYEVNFNETEKEIIEKNICNNLYTQSLDLIEYINPIYDDIETLSKYEYETLNKKELTKYKLDETGEFQSCRDNLFQIFEYIYICHDCHDEIDGVYFEYYSREGFLSYSHVYLCWLTNTPNENYIYDVENDTNITMKKYINIYDDLYIMYYYYIYY